MARTAKAPSTPPTLPPERALELLRRRRQRADELLASGTEAQIETWTGTTRDALVGALGSDHDVLGRFHNAGIRLIYTREPSPDATARKFLGERLPHLDSAIEIVESRVEHMGTNATDPAVETGTTVFVVHGHNDALRHSVARWLEANVRAGFTVVMLDEQASQGRTLIDKFEHHAGKAAYVVVLMTADDIGGPKRKDGEDDAAFLARLKPRARQNVVYELGYLTSRPGRPRVALLYEAEVELPTDIEGVAYVPVDGTDSWKERLRTELKAADLL